LQHAQAAHNATSGYFGGVLSLIAGIGLALAGLAASAASHLLYGLQEIIKLLKIGYHSRAALFPLGALVGKLAVGEAGHFGVFYFVGGHREKKKKLTDRY
jgi:hypothetical protein